MSGQSANLEELEAPTFNISDLVIPGQSTNFSKFEYLTSRNVRSYRADLEEFEKPRFDFLNLTIPGQSTNFNKFEYSTSWDVRG